MWNTSSKRSDTPSRSNTRAVWMSSELVKIRRRPGNRASAARRVGSCVETVQGHIVKAGMIDIRIDAVVIHQSAQGQAMIGEVALLQRQGLLARQAGEFLRRNR